MYIAETIDGRKVAVHFDDKKGEVTLVSQKGKNGKVRHWRFSPAEAKDLRDGIQVALDAAAPFERNDDQPQQKAEEVKASG